MPTTDIALRPIAAIGFIGLGVMGEPMCGHLARRSGLPVMAYDRRSDPLQRVAAEGVPGMSPAEMAGHCDLILMSLPDGPAVQSVLAEIEPLLKPGQVVVDTSTSPVEITREIGARLAAKGIANFREMLSRGEQTAPLRRNVTIEEVGNAAAFLCSDLASGITGEIVYVDAGYNIVGLPG